MRRNLLATALFAIALPACDSLTGSEGAANVAVRFTTASNTPSASGASFATSAADGEPGLVITGENGTLTIAEVHFILDEFKLERPEAPCEGLEGDAEDACEKFEAAPSFVQLPLGGGAVVAAAQEVPAGSYTSLKFETDDIDFEEESDEQGSAAVRALADAVHAVFPDWPADASMVVVGDFDGTPFTVYFDAEIKIEKAFDPWLVVEEDSRSVSVEVDPSAWFLSNGQVIDLSAYDYATTGAIVEFEAKMADGFSKIEFDS